MDNVSFERLLYEEESATLDFKKEQYRFVKATDEEKSELLKDILGLANAWRRSAAYILIGVEDVRGGRANVVGIPAADHLDDHSLQQFVNNLTNRPVRFHYAAFGIEGKQVGIIRVEEQPRPIYLKRDYGKLKKDAVYVRRGSSTDPAKPASIDEIAQMGHGAAPHSAELLVEFAEVARDGSLGTHASLHAEFCEMPPIKLIPNLVPRRERNSFLDIGLESLVSPFDRLNEDYFRELANYEFARRLFRPVRLLVKNIGQVAANRVRLEISVATGMGAMVIDESELPDPPRQRGDALIRAAALKGIRPARRAPGEVSIDKDDDRFRIEIDCGDLQPGRRVWSEVFYVGKGTSGDLALKGQVFAENLPQPKDFGLTISANVVQSKMTVDELTALPEPADSE